MVHENELIRIIDKLGTDSRIHLDKRTFRLCSKYNLSITFEEQLGGAVPIIETALKNRLFELKLDWNEAMRLNPKYLIDSGYRI